MATGNQQYDDELRGVLFKNDKKGNDKAPDYKGKVQVKGVEYELAAWLRTSQRTGQKFMSLKLDPPRDQQGGAAPPPPTQTTAAPAPAPTAEDFGMEPGTDPDDIPF